MQIKKEEAVQLEDYDTALKLKALVDKLKINGHKLLQLEQKKQEAVEGEDFLSAKSIKIEIDQIKREVAEIDAIDPFGSQRQLTMEQSLNQRVDTYQPELPQHSYNYQSQQQYYDQSIDPDVSI